VPAVIYEKRNRFGIGDPIDKCIGKVMELRDEIDRRVTEIAQSLQRQIATD
jgi:hypothetical protein